MDYDLLIIGVERDGIDRAIAAARDGLRAAVIRTIDSVPTLDVMRRAADNLANQSRLSMSSWQAEVARLICCQTDAEDAELDAAGVELISGHVRFVSPTAVEVWRSDERRTITTEETVLACGTKSRVPVTLRGDQRFVVNMESLFTLKEMPKSVIVVGGGETGLGAAIMLATLGVEVTVVDEHVTLLELCGLFETRFESVQSLNIAFRLGDEAIGTELRRDLQAAVRLASGRVLVADAVLVCVGKEGRTADLNLDAAGVGVDERGRLWCDVNGQTWTSQITAVGDVVGFRRYGDSLIPSPRYSGGQQRMKGFALKSLNESSNYEMVPI